MQAYGVTVILTPASTGIIGSETKVIKLLRAYYISLTSLLMRITGKRIIRLLDPKYGMTLMEL
jgi:hypothetical protein